MLKSPKVLWPVILVLLGAVLFMAKMFVFTGNTIPSQDDRTAILVTEDERTMILGEMRKFLETIQGVTEAAAAGDLKTVEELATEMGSTDVDMSPSLVGKLPIEFKTLGFATHDLFTDLGKTAKDGDVNAVLTELGDLMLNCTSCHAGHKFVIEGTAEAQGN
jgi:hypothetical protein